MRSLPVCLFTVIILCVSGLSTVQAQINPGGYTCSADFTVSQVLATAVVNRTIACILPTSVARRYDLSLEPDLTGENVMLTCVDFSVWSSNFAGDTEIFLRIYEDLSPADGRPNVADRLLLWEESVILPESMEGVNSATVPRSDGDVSLSLSFGGLSLTGDEVIIVELAHELSALVRWGANTQGNETLPAYSLSPNCTGFSGIASDYQTMLEFVNSEISLIQQLHFKVFECLSPDPEDDCNTNGQHDWCDLADGISFDCNSNGVPDECDLAAGTSLDCNGNLLPDECETDCNTNGIPDDCDISSGSSPDCDVNGIPDECDPDCNANGVPDACDVASGTSFDCNGTGIPDECEDDCNGNGIADTCDITTGSSSDCNVNGIPDECDIAQHFKSDCNENGIPDDCDIASGNAVDTDGDSFPDDCGCFENQTVFSPTGGANTFFGRSVEMDGDVAVVGSQELAAAFVYRFDGMTWGLEAQLVPDTPPGDFYAWVVAIDGDLIVVSDIINSLPVAHVFRYSPVSETWVFETTLNPELPTSTLGNIIVDDFLTVDGDVIALSIFAKNLVFVYRYDPATTIWSLESLLEPPPEPLILFMEVALDGDVLVVGELNEGPFVYRYDPATSSWLLEATLGDSTVNSKSHNVAVSGDVIIFSTVDFDFQHFSTGVLVYRYDGNSWLEEDVLYPAHSGNQPGLWNVSGFGNEIDIEGDLIIVPSQRISTVRENSTIFLGGVVYLYRHVNGRWIDDGLIRQPDFVPNGLTTESFGSSAHLSGDRLVVGARSHDTNGNNSGAAFFFTGLRNPDLDGNGLPDSCEFVIGDTNDDGIVNVLDLLQVLTNWGPCATCSADLNGDGIVSVSDLLTVLRHWGNT